MKLDKFKGLLKLFLSHLDEDININTENPEFCAWRWMKKEEIEEKIVPFKKSVYKKVFDEFSRKIYLK